MPETCTMVPGVAYNATVASANRSALLAACLAASADDKTVFIPPGYYCLDGTGLQGGGVIPVVDVGSSDLIIHAGATLAVGPDDTTEYCVFFYGSDGRNLTASGLTLLGPTNIPGTGQTVIGIYNAGAGRPSLPTRSYTTKVDATSPFLSICVPGDAPEPSASCPAVGRV